MRYSLRNKQKISAAFTEKFLNEHIIKSLQHYFETVQDVKPQRGQGLTHTKDFQAIRIIDIADENTYLEFAALGQTYDVIHLAYCGKVTKS